jgi:hypothetical protein
MAYQPHTGFHYPKLLTHFSHDYGRFTNISGMYLGGKFFFDYVLETFLPQKYMFWVHACICVAAFFNAFL